MQKSDICHDKNVSSCLSTLNQTNHFSARVQSYAEQRPKTANLIYADKPYIKQSPQWFQSSSTWRHSSRKQTFSKQKRFKTISPYSRDILQPQIKAERSNRAASFGKGRRTPIPQFIIKNAKEKPSPNSYSMNILDQMSRSPSNGKTFSMNWDKYQKVYLNHRKDVYSGHFIIDNPPAKYEVQQLPGKGAKAFTAYGRQKMFTEKMAYMMCHVPGPSHTINYQSKKMSFGLNNSFTSDKRMDLSKPANLNPGSKYNLSGFCDRFTNTKKKNDLQN